MSASLIPPSLLLPDVDDQEQSWPTIYQQEQIANFEYAIEVELAALRSQEAGRIQLDRFVRLLQTTRDEQIKLREKLDRLMEVLGA